MSELAIVDLKPYTIDSVSVDVEGASDVLNGLVHNIRKLNRASVYHRFILGAQLSAIRDRGLWREIAKEGHSVVSRNFDDWLKIEFKEISGYSRETGYAALQLFRSKFMRERPDEEIRQLESTTNAAIMARLERQGHKITDEIFQQAIQLPIKEFKERVGLPTEVRRVEAIVESPSNAESVGWLLGVVRSADSDSIDNSIELMQRIFNGPCGENSSDFFDCIAGLFHDYLLEQEEAMLHDTNHDDGVIDEIDLYQKMEEVYGINGESLYE